MPEKGVELLNHTDVLSYEDTLRFVKILALHGVNKIRITGGEPLVRKGVVNFVEKLSKINGITDISMTTNGVLFGQYALDLYNAGLKRINISLDSLNKDAFFKITRGGNLNAVLTGIEVAKKIGYSPIKINTVLIPKINDNELIDFVNFAIKLELNLRFIEYMPLGQNISETITSKELINKIKEVYNDFAPVEGKADSGSSVSKDFGFLGSKAIIGFISPLSDRFCEDCNRLRLTASGKLRLCLFYDSEYDIKKLLNENHEDETIFSHVLSLLQTKQRAHLFNEKANILNKPHAEGGTEVNWANEYMNEIGG
jgi:cyclic pyranopterin phosphate synthase